MNTFPISSPAIQGWDLSQLTMSYEQLWIAFELHAFLSKSKSPLPLSISRFESGTFLNEDVRVLEQNIIEHFSPLPCAAEYLKVLCKITDAINLKSSTLLPSPRVPNLAIRPKNPFRIGIPAALGHTRAWRDALKNGISSPVTPHKKGKPDQGTEKSLSQEAGQTAAAKAKVKGEQIELGKLFASAVLHGGLADAQLLAALARAMKQHQQGILVINERLAVELSISWQGEQGSEHRYWFPDPLTATFIVRWPKNSPQSLLTGDTEQPVSEQQIRKHIWQCIATFFRATDLKVNDRPKSLGSFVDNVSVDLQTRLPQVLANYANRSLVSHSPGKQVLARIHGLPIQDEADPHIEDFNEPPELITEFNNSSDNSGDLEPHWLRGLRASFATDNRAEIIRRIDALALNDPPASPEECFTRFARRLVAAHSASHNMLAISTAKSYLVTVSKRLGGRLGDVDPRSLDTETLEILYGEILEDADPESGARKQRRRIARALREFHHYLHLECGIESINDREVLGIGKGLVPVDANLITIDEYERILLKIPKSIKEHHRSIPAQEKLAKASKLIFMLAFKCGLRRMEVLKLKSADFCEHHPAELLIRPSEARRLKTKSSTRKMPLYALLSEQELAELKEWKVARRAEITTTLPVQEHEQFLFGIPELEFDFIPQDTLFKIIHEAMREVTGDRLLRFHHLRHSFASWTFLRLMLSDLPNIPRLFPDLPATTNFLNMSKEFRNTLYGRADMTRRHVYAVASLLGHSGPDISLEHYIHFCDVLLALWLEKDTVAPTRKPVIREAGQTRTTIYRQLSHGLFHVPFRLAKKRWPSQFRKSESKLGAKSSPTPQVTTSILDNPALFENVWELLYQHGMNGTPLNQLSASFGFTESMAESFVRNAAVIKEMKTSRGSKGYRHRMEEVIKDRRQKGGSSRLACPAAPRTASDKAIAKRLAPQILSVMKTKPDPCKKVFSYYLENAWQTRNEIIFKDPGQPEYAKQFIDFLNELGIKNSDTQFVSYDTSERSSALAEWKEKLGFSWRKKIIKVAPPRKTNISAKKWLGIKPVFSDGGEPGQPSIASPVGSIAFRYVLVLGAIIFLSWQEETYIESLLPSP